MKIYIIVAAVRQSTNLAQEWPDLTGEESLLLKAFKRKWQEPRWTGPFKVTARTIQRCGSKARAERGTACLSALMYQKVPQRPRRNVVLWRQTPQHRTGEVLVTSPHNGHITGPTPDGLSGSIVRWWGTRFGGSPTASVPHTHPKEAFSWWWGRLKPPHMSGTGTQIRIRAAHIFHIWHKLSHWLWSKSQQLERLWCLHLLRLHRQCVIRGNTGGYKAVMCNMGKCDTLDWAILEPACGKLLQGHQWTTKLRVVEAYVIPTPTWHLTNPVNVSLHWDNGPAPTHLNWTLYLLLGVDISGKDPLGIIKIKIIKIKKNNKDQNVPKRKGEGVLCDSTINGSSHFNSTLLKGPTGIVGATLRYFPHCSAISNGSWLVGRKRWSLFYVPWHGMYFHS